MKLPTVCYYNSTSSTTRDLIAECGAAVVAATQILANDPHPEASFYELLTLCWLVVHDADWVKSRNQRRARIHYPQFDQDDPLDIARAARNALRDLRRRKAGGRHRGWVVTYLQFVDEFFGDAGEIEVDADALAEQQAARDKREACEVVDVALGGRPWHAR
jgi:hypothetical protein